MPLSQIPFRNAQIVQEIFMRNGRFSGEPAALVGMPCGLLVQGERFVVVRRVQ